MASEVIVRGSGLTAADVVAVARQAAPVTIAGSALEAMQRSRAIVDRLSGEQLPVYGVSTGFGALAQTRVTAERQSELQHAVIRSHAAGMGPPIEPEVVRGMMLLRLRTLAMGYSGVRPQVAEGLAQLLNAGITPVVPEFGSLGASGDLAPLAHCALCLIGEGEAFDRSGRRVSAGEALDAAQLEPLRLASKEGLALINGTDGMLAMLVIAAADAANLFGAADITAAMSVEALLGTDRAFAADLIELRPQPGQSRSAANLVRLLAGSPILASHRHSDHAVQDSYSLRCTPQVNGAARDTLDHVNVIAGRELSAAIDNPTVLPEGRVESNGNFHGAPIGFACDFLAIAAAEVGSIAERRVDRLLDPNRSHGLPAFLAPEPGVNSGLMIAQYTAAALVVRNRMLAVPASTDSLPTSGMQEDHVSMGWSAARKLRELLQNLSRILAVELLCSARALDLRRPLEPGPATSAVVRLLRQHAPGPGPDRPPAPELAAACELIGSGAVVEAAAQVIGRLQ
ncbi:MAG: histidine ammonia-lyase [Candidatus Dormibacter sp.]|uniref:histidine ammonia-lyase n=1 Tax=Candidatus Dormibacter sp. TaxID=2973982 RepID=UPI000DB5ABC6|nr:MAG: histidine ammonia-lyase [Candidatus Dormibacteraeota bacterium]